MSYYTNAMIFLTDYEDPALFTTLRHPACPVGTASPEPCLDCDGAGCAVQWAEESDRIEHGPGVWYGQLWTASVNGTALPEFFSWFARAGFERATLFLKEESGRHSVMMIENSRVVVDVRYAAVLR